MKVSNTVGTVFAVVVESAPVERNGALVELAHVRHTSFVARLGGPEVLGEQVWPEVRRRGWEQAQDTRRLGDGAAWIRNQAALHFGASHQLVDWYHAKEQLVAAGQVLKSDHEDELLGDAGGGVAHRLRHSRKQRQAILSALLCSSACLERRSALRICCRCALPFSANASMNSGYASTTRARINTHR